MTIDLIGAGSGIAFLTQEAMEAIKGAELLIGAPRLLETFRPLFRQDAKTKELIASDEILTAIESSSADSVAVLFSGDSGFYSGAAGLSAKLTEKELPFRLLPGISSIQLFSAALKRPWQEWHLVSAHGRDIHPIPELMTGRDTCFLTDPKIRPDTICAALVSAGLPETRVFVGERLGTEGQSVSQGTAADFSKKIFDPLSILLVEKLPVRESVSGILDREVLRGDAPMTKQEVRSSIVNRLRIKPKDTVWDIGAGTGSVSVALAEAAYRGMVYAIEKKQEAFSLLQKNRERFLSWNMVPVQGEAPEALADLPAPDAVFLGGSGGALKELLSVVLKKNPDCKILLSAILLETVMDAAAFFMEQGLSYSVTTITVSESEDVSGKHLMRGQNPVFLLVRERSNP